MLKNVKIFLIMFALFIISGIGVGIYVYKNHEPAPDVVVETPNDILSNYQTGGVSARVSAKYTTHNVTKHMLNGNETAVDLDDNSNSQLSLQDNNIWLTKDNPDILIEYKFQNLSQDAIFIELDNRLELDNTTITYDVSDIPLNQGVAEESLSRQVLPTDRTKYIYVKISIEDESERTLFNGQICWNLSLAEVNITLNHNNDTKADIIKAQYGKEIPSVEVPSKNMNIFDGYANKDGNTYIDIFGKGTISNFIYDTELTAQYKHVSEVFELGNETVITGLKEENSNLKYINIPQGITEISNEAFKENANLETVILPSSLQTLGDSAFYNCANLKEVTMQEGLTTLGTSAFEKCVNLTTVTLPNSLISTGERVFFNTPELKNVDFPSNLQSIDLAAFAYSGLTQIELPDTLKSIEQSAFQDCNGLTSVTIPKNIEELGQAAFGRSVNLEEVIFEEGTKLTSISSYCFRECSKLKTVNIAEGIKNIGQSAFYYCYDLNSVDLPEGLENIDKWAFYYCGELSSIDVPNSVKSIEYAAFSHCYSLTDINIPTELETIGDYAFNYCQNLEIDLVIPSGVKTIGNASFQMCNKIKSLTLNDNLTYIDNYAFFGCENITNNLVIPSEVTTIGNHAFFNCKNITGDLVIPSSVTSMGTSAFYNCSKIETLVINEGLTNIDDYVFYMCFALKSVKLPNGVTNIGDHAFGSCENLVSILVPNTVQNIGTCAFRYCSKLLTINKATLEENESINEVTLPTDLTTIGDYAFELCSNLFIGQLSISAKITSIGTGAFARCSQINAIEVDVNNPNYYSEKDGEKYNAIISNEKVLIKGCDITIIPNDIIEISAAAFYSCNNLTTISLPDTLVTIGNSAFSNCGRLIIDLVLPSSVKYIGSYAFNSCGLKGLTLNEGLVWIGNYAFSYCSSIANNTITIPSTVVQIGENSYIGDNETNSIVGGCPFYSCANRYVTKFEVAEGNTHFKTDEYGVLYTINNKYLVAYPTASEMTEYSILEGCVQMYEKSIGYASNLITLGIPNSLMLEYDDENVAPSSFQYKTLNPLLSGAYLHSSIATYVVNADNPNYKSVDGIIYSKDGTRVIAVPVNNWKEQDGKKVLEFIDSATRIENIFGHNASAGNVGYPDIIKIGAQIEFINEYVIEDMNSLVEICNTTIQIDSANKYYKIVNGKIVAINN